MQLIKQKKHCTRDVTYTHKGTGSIMFLLLFVLDLFSS